MYRECVTMFREAYEEYKTATADSRTKRGAGASADAVPTEDKRKIESKVGAKK